MKARKIILLIFLLFLTAPQLMFSQLHKSFDNEQEWRLSWKLWESSSETQDYNQCSQCMDSILQMTDEPDLLIFPWE